MATTHLLNEYINDMEIWKNKQSHEEPYWSYGESGHYQELPDVAAGKYTIDISIGTYTVTASKTGIYQTAEGVEVLEGQTTTVNFQLGSENMKTYTGTISIVGSNTKLVNIIPKEEPTVSIKFLDAGIPIATKTIELLSEDEKTILQTKTTDSSGIAIFNNVLHGIYKFRIIY